MTQQPSELVAVFKQSDIQKIMKTCFTMLEQGASAAEIADTFAEAYCQYLKEEDSEDCRATLLAITNAFERLALRLRRDKVDNFAIGGVLTEGDHGYIIRSMVKSVLAENGWDVFEIEPYVDLDTLKDMTDYMSPGMVWISLGDKLSEEDEKKLKWLAHCCHEKDIPIVAGGQKAVEIEKLVQEIENPTLLFILPDMKALHDWLNTDDGPCGGRNQLS